MADTRWLIEISASVCFWIGGFFVGRAVELSKHLAATSGDPTPAGETK